MMPTPFTHVIIGFGVLLIGFLVIRFHFISKKNIFNFIFPLVGFCQIVLGISRHWESKTPISNNTVFIILALGLILLILNGIFAFVLYKKKAKKIL